MCKDALYRRVCFGGLLAKDGIVSSNGVRLIVRPTVAFTP